MQARSEAKRFERLEQIVAALLEMRPTLIMDWNDHGVGKSLCGFDGIVSVHREMKGATRLRRARKQKDDIGRKAARHLGDAVVPDRVAGDINVVEAILQHKADHITGQ